MAHAAERQLVGRRERNFEPEQPDLLDHHATCSSSLPRVAAPFEDAVRLGGVGQRDFAVDRHRERAGGVGA